MVTHGEWHLWNDFPGFLSLLMLMGASRAPSPFLRKAGTWESSLAVPAPWPSWGSSAPTLIWEGITSLAFCLVIGWKSHLALGEVAGAVLETHRRGNKNPSKHLGDRGALGGRMSCTKS